MGAQAAILPEALDAGWTDESVFEIADAIPAGPTFQLLAKAASENRVYVTAGISERAEGKIYNSAVLISPEGELLLLHRKINELNFARKTYSTGDRLQVCDTALGRVGIMICADAFAEGQALSRSLCLMGAELIFSPCAWAVPAGHNNQTDPYGQLWLDHYCPVAKQHGTWIFGVSNVGPITSGPWSGRKCIGNSLAIDAAGKEAARGSYGEEAEEIVLIEV
jgi:predicted amidohydrolase